MHTFVLAYLAIIVSFTLSASVGLGGSLILVPSLALLLGTKQGVALAALLLAINNVGKVIVYWRHIPIRIALMAVAVNTGGTLIGAIGLIQAPESWVRIAIFVTIVSAFLLERFKATGVHPGLGWPLMFLAGTTSGFSGTSGPLKGLGLRAIGLSRMRFVGAASALGLVSDMAKAAVFSKAALINAWGFKLALCALPVIPLAALIGRRINQQAGRRMLTGVFWAVMAGYAVRLLPL